MHCARRLDSVGDSPSGSSPLFFFAKLGTLTVTHSPRPFPASLSNSSAAAAPQMRPIARPAGFKFRHPVIMGPTARPAFPAWGQQLATPVHTPIGCLLRADAAASRLCECVSAEGQQVLWESPSWQSERLLRDTQKTEPNLSNLTSHIRAILSLISSWFGNIYRCRRRWSLSGRKCYQLSKNGYS